MASRRLRPPYGDTANLSKVVLLAGELATNISGRVHVGDGVTPGGLPSARKAEVDALSAQVATKAPQSQVTALAADVQTLQESQVSGAIVYDEWATLAAHPTEDLTAGALAKVHGDAGTHTDPVTAATVDNAGVYSYVVGTGWKRVANIEADDAAAQVALAEAAAAQINEKLTDQLRFPDGDKAVIFAGRDADDVLREFGSISRVGELDIAQSEVRTPFGAIRGVQRLEPPSGKIVFLSADGGFRGELDPGADEAMREEVATARGEADSLAERLAPSLSPNGYGLAPVLYPERLRRTRTTTRKLLMGGSAQLAHLFLGDSWTALAERYVQAFAEKMQDTLGDAGMGWIGCSWYQFTGSPEPRVLLAGTANPGYDGTARPASAQLTDVGSDVQSIQAIGNWTSYYIETPQGAPALGSIRSTTAGDLIRWAFRAGHTSAQLFYDGDGTGVVQVSWDDGGSWSSNIALNTVGSGRATLAGAPATAGIAQVKVISGAVRVSAVVMRSTAAGVRVHKLGASGSRTDHWAAATAADWQANIAALIDGMTACAWILLGTNDQYLPATVAAYVANLATMVANLRAADPLIEVVIAMPSENLREGNAIPMADYALAAREWAAANGCAFLDLQDSFGPADDPAEYADLFADAIHPVYASASPTIVDPMLRLALPAY